LAADPFKNFKSIHSGHFDVEEDELRKRVLGAVSILSSGAEVGDCLFAIGDDMNGNGQVCLSEQGLDENDFVLAIFGNQNGLALHREALSFQIIHRARAQTISGKSLKEFPPNAEKKRGWPGKQGEYEESKEFNSDSGSLRPAKSIKNLNGRAN
jgi:hypothetical protein